VTQILPARMHMIADAIFDDHLDAIVTLTAKMSIFP
jgi:hypothetical protein